MTPLPTLHHLPLWPQISDRQYAQPLASPNTSSGIWDLSNLSLFSFISNFSLFLYLKSMHFNHVEILILSNLLSLLKLMDLSSLFCNSWPLYKFKQNQFCETKFIRFSTNYYNSSYPLSLE